MLAGLAQLGQPGLGDIAGVVSVIARLDAAGSVAELTVRTGHNNGPDVLVGILGEHATGARRLVIGMGVHGHESQRMSHTCNLPTLALCVVARAWRRVARCPCCRLAGSAWHPPGSKAALRRPLAEEAAATSAQDESEPDRHCRADHRSGQVGPPRSEERRV